MERGMKVARVRSWQGVELARVEMFGFVEINCYSGRGIFVNFISLFFWILRLKLFLSFFFFFQFGGSFRLIVRKESWFWIFFFSAWFKIFRIYIYFPGQNFHNSGSRIRSRRTLCLDFVDFFFQISTSNSSLLLFFFFLIWRFRDSFCLIICK